MTIYQTMIMIKMSPPPPGKGAKGGVSCVPFKHCFSPMEIFYDTRFVLKHHMIVQLADIHMAGTHQPILSILYFKGPQYGALFGS